MDKTHKESTGLDPKEIISFILRYKWFVCFSIIAGAVGAWYYADNVTPTYESSGTILITSSNSTPDDELSQIVSQATGYGTGSSLANELQIMRSREFSRQLAQSLIEEEQGGNINEFPVLYGTSESGEIYRVSEDAVAARVRSTLTLNQPVEDSDIVEISFRSPSPVEAATIVNEAMEIYVESSTRQNRQAAQATAEFLQNEKQQIEQDLLTSEERLQSFMDTSGIIQINEQASSVIRQRAETDAELRRVNLELQTIAQTISFHEEELEAIKPGLVDQISAAIGPRIREAQTSLASYESERTLIVSKNPGVLERVPLPNRLQFLNSQIERLSMEIKSLSDQLFAEDSEYLGMDSDDRSAIVVDLQRRLVDLRIEQNQYNARRAALTQYKEEMDSNFNSLPEEMTELAKLQRDVSINEELYLNVSRQFADMSVWTHSQFGFGRIIDLAETSDVPVYPNKKILTLLGLMLGGALSIGFITVKEMMDNSVKNLDQLRTVYLPTLTLSVIPTFEKIAKKKRKSFVVSDGQIPEEMVLLLNRSSFAAESIRRLKNNIIYQNGYVPPKTISVTSPEKKDGKSTIASNLGVAFAEEGYRTLLIDADFRRPKLHKYFGLNNKTGLSDYFAGKIPYEQLVKGTDVSSLKVITAGSEVQRPDTIINSETFKRFRKKMEEVYDVVILDTAPFGIISDSASLLKDTEALLVVVGHRKTNQGMLFNTIEELEHIQANITGVVLNNFNHKKESGYYFGSGQYKALYSNYEAYVN